MCQQCNYTELLDTAGIGPTPNRVRIMELIGSHPIPIGTQDILTTLTQTTHINRVTVYRILDLLVKKGLVERISGYGRSPHYGMAPTKDHPAHPHFQCNACGMLQCLQPNSLTVNIKDIQRSFPGQIRGVEVRVSGICRDCLQTDPASPTKRKITIKKDTHRRV